MLAGEAAEIKLAKHGESLIGRFAPTCGAAGRADAPWAARF